MLQVGDASSRRCFKSEMLQVGDASSRRCFKSEMLQVGDASSRRCFKSEMFQVGDAELVGSHGSTVVAALDGNCDYFCSLNFF